MRCVFAHARSVVTDHLRTYRENVTNTRGSIRTDERTKSDRDDLGKRGYPGEAEGLILRGDEVEVRTPRASPEESRRWYNDGLIMQSTMYHG